MKTETSAILPPNPFNPGSPVDPNDFVGRTRQIEEFKQKLRQTAGGSLASMAVTGGYGVGKTSFLHKCKSIAEAEKALTIYFSLSEMKAADKRTLSEELMERIKEKVREEVLLKRMSEDILGALVKIHLKSDAGLEMEIRPFSPSSKSPNLQAALKEAWWAIKGNRIAIVFLIDEARTLEANKAELLLYLRAVLEQLQADRIPVMMIPAGKLSLSGPSGTGFSPLVRSFPPAVMENFTLEECRSFVNRKLAQVSVEMKPELVDEAYKATEGHPFVLTAYMASAYSKLQPDARELKKEHFQAADIDFVSRALAPFFSRFYEGVGRESRRILDRFAESPGGIVSLSELSSSLKKKNNELSPLLAKLVQDGAIIRIDRGKYKIFHHLFGGYVKGQRGRNG